MEVQAFSLFLFFCFVYFSVVDIYYSYFLNAIIILLQALYVTIQISNKKETYDHTIIWNDRIIQIYDLNTHASDIIILKEKTKLKYLSKYEIKL